MAGAADRKFAFISKTALILLALAASPVRLSAEEPISGGTLTVGLAQEPLIVDPIRSGTFTERQYAAPVYEALFDINEEGQTVPFLAESYEASSDAKTYTVKLRRGIKFHDGTPLDSAAVAANFERTRNPANACRCLSSLLELESVDVLDDYTVQFKLSTGNSAFPTVLADAPGMMVSPSAFKANPSEIGLKPVGTGPFKFSEWIRNSRLVFVKNRDYWRLGKPYLDSIVLRGIQNPETMQAAFLSGQSDMVLQASTRFVAQAKREGKYNVLQPGGFGYDGVYMNLTEPPFDDVRVRRAVAHAIDRELLRKTLLNGIPRLAFSPYGPGMWANQPVPNYPVHDKAKAKELIAAYGKPVAFTLTHNNSPQSQQLAQSLQEMLGDVGAKVDLFPVDQNRIVQNMNSKQFVASLYRFTGRADPHINTYTFYHSRFADVTPSANYWHYKNPKVDELLERGMTSLDQAERKKIYGDIAALLAQDLPVAYLFYPADSIVTSRKIHGVREIPDGLVRFGEIWKN
ncbi:ABC transporter substrate-binding protein [Bradyrhizobium sp. BR13661]|uniref:ABC transporter substrate-binding protein n=2 Tax=Bacteria TaxID=2 RepID=UPI002476500D|nr:ABC transporter substrate-binding protein [Bradyrhizobium sp. BR13661]MDH6260527.1 peptide/nickel transport system substrate-binding protein [Bradyrhizobium sp. BR13661]